MIDIQALITPSTYRVVYDPAQSAYITEPDWGEVREGCELQLGGLDEAEADALMTALNEVQR
jgi:hypothetical protein